MERSYINIMTRQWTNIKVVDGVKRNIVNLESKYGVVVPYYFKNFLISHHAGYLKHSLPYIWDIKRSRGFLFSNLLSFDENDSKNVYSIIDDINLDRMIVKFIPFAEDKESKYIFCVNDVSIYVYNRIQKELYLLPMSAGTFLSKITEL